MSLRYQLDFLKYDLGNNTISSRQRTEFQIACVSHRSTRSDVLDPMDDPSVVRCDGRVESPVSTQVDDPMVDHRAERPKRKADEMEEPPGIVFYRSEEELVTSIFDPVGQPWSLVDLETYCGCHDSSQVMHYRAVVTFFRSARSIKTAIGLYPTRESFEAMIRDKYGGFINKDGLARALALYDTALDEATPKTPRVPLTFSSSFMKHVDTQFMCFACPFTSLQRSIVYSAILQIEKTINDAVTEHVNTDT
jgi:hypothetical protein